MTTPASRASRSGSDAADRSEPRALRTRVAVLDVVREALGEMPLGQLTVAEICRRAGIHRVTFYGHWKDVDAAAADALTEVIDGISAIDEDAIAVAGDARSLAALYEDAQRELLVEFAEHRDAYRQMAESPLFGRKLREMLGHRAELAIAALERTGVDVPGVRSGIAAAQLSGGITAATLVWLRSDAPDSPADLAATAAELTAQLPAWWPRG